MNKHYLLLLEIIREKVALSDREAETFASAFHTVVKKKNEYLIKDGDSFLQLYFIVTGHVRCFYVDEEGNEITTQISAGKEFVTSFESFLNNEYSKENVQCISDCTLLSISSEEYNRLYKTISNWPLFCQSVYENQIVKISERVHSLQILSASNRYLKLLNQQPDIALHTPVKYLASYLGIQPQSLSRIRRKIK